MSVVVTFTVPGESLPLGRATPAEGVRVELDSVVPLGGQTLP